MKIFVFSSGEQTGPYTKDEIRRELLNGSLKSSDLAWHNRLRRWVPLQNLAMIEPRSKKKYSMPPNPEDSPFYTGEKSAKPSTGKRKAPVASRFSQLLRRLIPGSR